MRSQTHMETLEIDHSFLLKLTAIEYGTSYACKEYCNYYSSKLHPGIRDIKHGIESSPKNKSLTNVKNWRKKD